MQQVFKSAIYHRAPVVLGRQLLPLCLGHVYLLMAADSPYAVPKDEPPHLLNLAFAVAICSRSFEDCQSWIESPGVEAECAAWGASCEGMDFPAESDTFAAYLADSAVLPDKAPRGAVTPYRHPWPMVVAVSIMPLVGSSSIQSAESRAWNMPQALAMSYHSALSELQGDDSLKTDADYAVMEENKRRESAAGARN